MNTMLYVQIFVLDVVNMVSRGLLIPMLGL